MHVLQCFTNAWTPLKEIYFDCLYSHSERMFSMVVVVTWAIWGRASSCCSKALILSSPRHFGVYWFQMIPKEVTICGTGDCGPLGRVGLGDPRTVSASPLLQMRVCGIFGVLVRWNRFRLEWWTQLSSPVTMHCRKPSPSVSYYRKSSW